MSSAGRSFSWWAVLAAVLHAGAGFVYLVSGLVAPLAGVAFLLAVWFVLAWWLWTLRGTPRALAVPAAAAVIWFVTLWIGGALWNWTA